MSEEKSIAHQKVSGLLLGFYAKGLDHLDEYTEAIIALGSGRNPGIPIYATSLAHKGETAIAKKPDATGVFDGDRELGEG